MYTGDHVRTPASPRMGAQARETTSFWAGRHFARSAAPSWALPGSPTGSTPACSRSRELFNSRGQQDFAIQGWMGSSFLPLTRNTAFSGIRPNRIRHLKVRWMVGKWEKGRRRGTCRTFQILQDLFLPHCSTKAARHGRRRPLENGARPCWRRPIYMRHGAVMLQIRRRSSPAMLLLPRPGIQRAGFFRRCTRLGSMSLLVPIVFR